jgi:hypothetical protein
MSMKKTVWVISVFSVFFFVYVTHAQFGKGAMSKFYFDFKPIVGGWSEFQMASKAEAPIKEKIAIVREEEDVCWCGTVMEDKKAGKMITNMLVSGNQDDPNSIERVIIKGGNDPAIEMPSQMWEQDSKPQESKGKLIKEGKETIKVAAGTFTTQHFQYQELGSLVDTWVYKDVSSYGLIKSQFKDFEMLLIGYVTDAKDPITETPRKLEISQFGKKPLKNPVLSKQEEEEDDDDYDDGGDDYDSGNYDENNGDDDE